MPTLTYREAAQLVGRSKRAIQYWRARGMIMTFEVREGQRVRVVELTVLQAWFREKLANNSAHQRKMHARRRETERHAQTRQPPNPPPPWIAPPTLNLGTVSHTDTTA